MSISYAIDQNNRYGTTSCNQQQVTTENNDSNSAFATSWESYGTLKELARHADVIVVGKVSDCVRIHSHPADKDLRLTDFEVVVERTVKGNLPADKLTVHLLAPGPDNHIMAAGERYVLFLAYADATGAYAPLGGPQGRYQIQNGDLVCSLDCFYPDVSFISVKAKDKPLDEFLSEVQSAT